jgi:hypothetical protein
MFAMFLILGIPRNPKHILLGTSLGFEYMKQGKYISGDERGGFKVAKVNLPLADGRLRLFIQGKEDWLEEGLLVPARKNKRGRIVEEGSSAAQEGGAQQIMCHHMEEFQCRQVTTVVHQCKHGGSGAVMPPLNYVVPNIAFAEPYAQFPQPQQSVAIIGGYAARNMQNIAAIQANAAQLGEGHANIAYEPYKYLSA